MSRLRYAYNDVDDGEYPLTVSEKECDGIADANFPNGCSSGIAAERESVKTG
jgi:hypothetical protein